MRTARRLSCARHSPSRTLPRFFVTSPQVVLALEREHHAESEDRLEHRHEPGEEGEGQEQDWQRGQRVQSGEVPEAHGEDNRGNAEREAFDAAMGTDVADPWTVFGHSGRATCPRT